MSDGYILPDTQSPAVTTRLLATFSRCLRFLHLSLLFDQQCVQLEGLWQDNVSDGAASNCELIQVDGVLVCVWRGLPLMVSLTFCRKAFILMSTPLIEPTTMVPFLSSIVTVSFFSFIRNRTSFIFNYKSQHNIINTHHFDFIYRQPLDKVMMNRLGV